MCILYISVNIYLSLQASQVVLMVKNSPANEGDIRDPDSIPRSGRSPEGGMATHSGVLAGEYR